jgi:chromosome segregation ATPase
MIHRGLACLLVGSLTLTSCAQNGQVSDQGRTVAEGAGLGALLGAGLGAAFGGGRGAAIGAGAGLLVGLAAGGYVAQQKRKYATIEQRIAGERQIAAQATATARSQTAASAAQLAVVDAQLRDLNAATVDKANARATATTMLANLQHQRSELESQKKDLEGRVKNQQDFIVETEKEIGTSDPQKTAQLAEWKAEMPAMQEAVTGMTTQISDIAVMETRVERVKSVCC